LGRDVSMSPIEIAKAFAAPSLAGASDPNATSKRLLQDVGDKPIKYGTVWDAGSKLDTSVATLKFDDAERCEKPTNGQVFGQ
ncbi:hypothetical protein BDV95DRAFT_503759, partial [Massariosphaeria phaeospora]